MLADARAGKTLTPGEWRMLAFYSWETDEAMLAGEDQRAALVTGASRGLGQAMALAFTHLRIVLEPGGAVTLAAALLGEDLPDTVIAIATVDKWGRKPLMLVGTLGMGVSLGAMGWMAQNMAALKW